MFRRLPKPANGRVVHASMRSAFSETEYLNIPSMPNSKRSVRHVDPERLQEKVSFAFYKIKKVDPHGMPMKSEKGWGRVTAKDIQPENGHFNSQVTLDVDGETKAVRLHDVKKCIPKPIENTSAEATADL